MKRHPSPPLTPNLPPKVARRNPIPNIIDPPTNDHLLEQIEQQEFKDMLSSQVGFGVTQLTPSNENIPEEVRDFFQEDQPWGLDRNLRQVYIQNFRHNRNS